MKEQFSNDLDWKYGQYTSWSALSTKVSYVINSKERLNNPEETVSWKTLLEMEINASTINNKNPFKQNLCCLQILIESIFLQRVKSMDISTSLTS